MKVIKMEVRNFNRKVVFSMGTVILSLGLAAALFFIWNLPSPTGAMSDLRPDGVSRSRVTEAYGKLPLIFETNQGQSDGDVRFLSRGRGSTLFLSPSEAILILRSASRSG